MARCDSVTYFGGWERGERHECWRKKGHPGPHRSKKIWGVEGSLTFGTAVGFESHTEWPQGTGYTCVSK